MKRLLIVLIALVAVFALVLPASAADLKFGGMFWTKWYSTKNIKDGTDQVNDSLGSYFYTRMRLYFTAIASENLRAVSKMEVDANWGDGRIGKVSIDGGSDGRGDVGNSLEPDIRATDNGSANSGFEIKNAYIDFTIPDTVLNFKVGLGPAKLGKAGLAFNDDTPLIMATYPYAPIKVSLMYSQINDNMGIDPITGSFSPGTGSSPMTGNRNSDNWNAWGFDIQYAQEAFSADFNLTYVSTGDYSGRADGETTSNDFEHWNFVVDADYKADVWSAYLTAGFNTGDIQNFVDDRDATGALTGTTSDADFKGWMITVGGKYDLTDMISVGLDFYYSSGDDINDTVDTRTGVLKSDTDLDAYETFGVIGRPSYYMDDIVFPGWFDDETATVNTAAGNVSNAFNNVTATGLTASNQGYTPNNVMAIGLHADLKPLEQTLIQPGFAYLQFAEDVLESVDPVTGQLNTGTDMGWSLYLRANQGITDGLALKATFGYLFTGDAYAPQLTGTGIVDTGKDDAYKFAAGLFWSW